MLASFFEIKCLINNISVVFYHSPSPNPWDDPWEGILREQVVLFEKNVQTIYKFQTCGLKPAVY